MPARSRLLPLLLAALIFVSAIPAAAQGTPTAAQFGDPPIAGLIAVSMPDESGEVTITGANGAVFPGAVVAVRNLYTGETVYVNANVNGAFTARLYGPGNTPFWISPARQIPPAEQRRSGSLPGGPGTILYGPFPEQQRDRIPFTLSGTAGGGSGAWQAEGSINALTFEPGDTLDLELRVTMNAPGRVSDTGDFRLGARLWLKEVLPAGGNGWSATLTLTGLPVEGLSTSGLLLGDSESGELSTQDDALAFTLRWQISLDEPVRAGVYTFEIEGFAGVTGVESGWAESGVLGRGDQVGLGRVRLPVVIRLGEGGDLRLPWTLFQDTPSQGSRGIAAEEDAGTFGLSNRVAFNASSYVLPRIDPATGQPIPYPLEPYLPTMLSNSYFEFVPPLMPLRFPSGELSVRVTRPDGTVDDLGSAPFVQNRLSNPAQDEAQIFGATSPLDVYRLTTLDPRFTAYTFAQDGLHTITLTGTVEDVWGNVYTGGGEYRVWIAEPLDLSPGVLLGTPFEVGDAFNPALTVQPGGPADVAIRLQVAPLDGGEPIVYTAEGQTDAQGYFQPERGGDPWWFAVPGEYVVDYTASYTDSVGRLWMGSLRGAGVIASPDGPLIAHGGRGAANIPVEDRLAWYALDHAAPGLLQNNPDAHLRWPYFGGDVLWSSDEIGSIQPVIRAQDTAGDYAAWLNEQFSAWRSDDGMTLAQLANADELPALGSQVYFSAVRPDAGARQFVQGGEPLANFARADWNMDDPYNHQYGVGINGDLPGDFLFLFGGLVVRNDEIGLSDAAIYGALAVVIDPDDPRGDRVYPPFGSAAGGPDGGPLLTVRGQPVEMFFHPTGFRSGQVFTMGDTLTLAGQVAPTLPALVAADVIAPSGVETTIAGRANAVGYFYDPAQDVALDEPGLWRIRLRVTYDGITSAGQVQPPYPTGGILGAEGGEVVIYVLPADAPAIPLTQPVNTDSVLPAAQPFNVVGRAPEGWSGVTGHVTVTMPGYVLASGPLNMPGGSFSYNISPRTLAQSFPNLDVVQAGTQIPAATDVVTITVFLSGTDAEGRPAFAARTVTMLGKRVIVGQ